MFTLNIDHPAAAPGVENYCVETIRPSNDSIISMHRDGTVVSTFVNDIWDLTPYASRVERLHFEMPTRRGPDQYLETNRLLWKRVIYWALYGLRTPVSVGSICGMFQAFRYVVKVCANAGIRIDRLKHHPKVYEQLSKVPPSMWPTLRTFLARLDFDRKVVGFEILGASELERIGHRIPRKTHEQTAFIPDRIYFYVLDRCETIVDDYLARQAEFEELYAICSKAYARARAEFGPKAQVSCLKERKVAGKRVPLSALEIYAGSSFMELAGRLDVLASIQGVSKSKRSTGMQQLGSYLSSVALASRILLAAFSAARDEEHGSLDRDCLESRDDDVLGRVYLLKGSTKKTVKDGCAYWTTSEVSVKCVAAAASISRLREQEAGRNPRFRQFTSKGSALLFPRVTDPWIGRIDVLKVLHASGAHATARSTLCVVLRGLKGLFDPAEMCIRQEDLDQALRLNPDLNTEKFAVGRIWPLAWHQFRRTLVCHAAGAGVSIAATAWQLKHVGPWMAQHYRNNYFNLNADPDLADEFARTQVEMLLIRAGELSGRDFVPLSQEGKCIAIRLISGLEEKALKEAAKEGKVSFRETGPGLCTHPDCSLGGWEHVAECVGCGFGFAQRSKRPTALRMLALAQGELAECGPGDAMVVGSLSAQVKALEEIVRVTE